MAIAVLVSACGSDGGDSTTSTTGAEESSATTLAEGTISVVLADVDEETQSMTLSADSSASGTVTFMVTNTGNMEHEFLVVATDLTGADLPYDEASDRVPESEIDVLDEIEGIAPGETKSLEIDLASGHYVLLCNLAKHWRQGMHADFTAT